MIIIINGSLGVGKTEISWELIERFDRAVMLDGDYLGAVHLSRSGTTAAWTICTIRWSTSYDFIWIMGISIL